MEGILLTATCIQLYHHHHHHHHHGLTIESAQGRRIELNA